VASQGKGIAPKRKSKRQRRQKIIVFIMIIAMLLSTITAGLALFAF